MTPDLSALRHTHSRQFASNFHAAEESWGTVSQVFQQERRQHGRRVTLPQDNHLPSQLD